MGVLENSISLSYSKLFYILSQNQFDNIYNLYTGYFWYIEEFWSDNNLAGLVKLKREQARNYIRWNNGFNLLNWWKKVYHKICFNRAQFPVEKAFPENDLNWLQPAT